MNARFQTHYDVLGVKSNASNAEISRAYQRHKSRLQDVNVAPDRRFEMKLEEAYAVLLDDDKRGAYDRFLLTPSTVAKRSGIDRKTAILGAAVIAIAAGGAYVWLQPKEKPAFTPRTVEQMHIEASPSVGRLSSIDLSGQDKPIAVAFTSHEGVMTTVCKDVAPGVQLVVNIAPRKVPARVQSVDEASGFCTLAVDGGGSFPLRLSQAEPRTGDMLYVPSFDASGALKIGQTKVKATSGSGEAREFVLEAPVPAGYAGLPLFDSAGRVVAVADVQGKVRPIPGEWLAVPTKAAAPTPVAAPQAEAQPKEGVPMDMPAQGVIPTSPTDFTPERKKKLEEAFRPPPKVPDDL